MRSFRSRMLGASALAAVVALVAAGCAGSSTPDTSAAPQTLVIDKSFDLITADPARMFETTGNIVLHAVYDSLLTFTDGDSTTPQPSLAESWEANDDATQYTFTLRDGVTFSDGTPLTSADVVFSLMRVKNVQGNGSFLMEGLTVTAPDDRRSSSPPRPDGDPAGAIARDGQPAPGRPPAHWRRGACRSREERGTGSRSMTWSRLRSPARPTRP